jgi:hypothetical protein
MAKTATYDEMSLSLTGKLTAALVLERVERGATWLDTLCPGWANGINLQELDLRSPKVCVLGQTDRCILGPREGDDDWTTEGYWRVMRHFGASNAWSAKNGFAIDPDEIFDRDQQGIAYEMLQIAWIEQIKKRRGES